MANSGASVPGLWRLLLPATLAWIASALLISHPGAARYVTTGLLVALVGAVLVGAVLMGSVIGIRQGKPVWKVYRSILGAIALSLAALLIIAVRVDVLEHSRQSANLQHAAETREVVTLAGKATGFAKRLDGFESDRFWLTADLESSAGVVPMTLWLDSSPGMIVPGSKITVTGTLRVLAPSDRSAYSVSAQRVVLEPANHPLLETLQQLVADLREGITAASATVGGAELVPGFAVGDTSLISHELDRVMLQSSLTHLVAVSGANCALIIAVAVFGASWLGIGRRSRMLLAGLLLAGFVTVVGPDASVERAAIMAAVTLVSQFGGKRQIAMPALAIAMLVMLVLNPWQAMQAGFVLSVAATAGILLFTPAFSRTLNRRLRMPRWLALSLAVTLAAQLTCTPFLLLLEPGLPVGGILANLLAVPVAPFGTGIGLLAMLVLPWAPQLGMFLVWLAGWASKWVIATAEVIADFPGNRWHWPGGVTGAVLITVCMCTIGIAVMVLRGQVNLPGGARVSARQPWRSARKPDRIVRVTVAVFVSLGTSIFIAVTAVAPAIEWTVTPRDWIVVACDVGQGDAILLRDPAQLENVMLVDTGDDAENLTRCLDRFGVRSIDLLVLSHDDRDHVGALHAVVNRARHALISPPVTGDRESREVERELEQGGVPFTVGHAGMRGHIGQGSSWHVLAPGLDHPILGSNEASLVMTVDLSGVRVLLLGDTGREEHRRLVHHRSEVNADLVKIAHHGSSDQDPALLGATGAEFGLVSAGKDNQYGHPSDHTIRAMREHGLHALRTDELGSIAISIVDGSLRVWSERAP